MNFLIGLLLALLIIFVFLAIFAWPIKWASRWFAAGKVGFWWGCLAFICGLLLNIIVHLFITYIPIINILTAPAAGVLWIVIPAWLYHYILDTNFPRGVAIYAVSGILSAVIFAAVFLLVMLCMALFMPKAVKNYESRAVKFESQQISQYQQKISKNHTQAVLQEKITDTTVTLHSSSLTPSVPTKQEKPAHVATAKALAQEPEYEYQTISVQSLAKYLNRPAKLYLKDGREQTGTIQRVNKQVVELKKVRFGGTFTMYINYDDIVKAEVLVSKAQPNQ